MKDRRSFFTSWAIFLVVFIVLGVIVNLLASNWSSARLDLTQDGIRTLSKHTRDIIEGLEEQITIQYYVSEQMPSDRLYLPRDTKEALAEWKRVGGDRIRVEIIDPEKLIAEYVEEKEAEGDSEEKIPSVNPFARGPKNPREEKEMELAQMGVPKLTGRVPRGDKLEIISFYSSIRITYLDKSPEAIPMHASVEQLEYELANRILKLTLEDKPKFGFFLGREGDVVTLPPNPMAPQLPPQQMHPYEPLLDALEDKFTAVDIELTADSPAIPDDIDLLIVAEPDALEERQVYELDRFLGRGGTLWILSSRVSGEPEEPFPVTPLRSGLDTLYREWGVTQREDILSSRECTTVNVERVADIGGGRGIRIPQPVPFPLIPYATGNGISQESGFTIGLPVLFFPFATPLEHDPLKVESNSLELTVLARSSEQSWLASWAPQVNEQMVQPPEDAAGEPRFADPQDLAYLIEGVFPTPFAPGSDRPHWQSDLEPPPDDGTEAAATDGAENHADHDHDHDHEQDHDHDHENEADGQDHDDDGAEDGKPAWQPPAAEPVPPQERQRGRVVLCASGDMARIQFLKVSGLEANNIPFFLNIIETVSLGRGLPELRSKTMRPRPLKELEPWSRILIAWGGIAGVPVLVMFFGVARFVTRRGRSARYEEQYLREQSGGTAQ